ncbi:YitT family protein [Neobacillus mesonae]|uniref:YitT family protein n=1 Tax=Neobacillus mesonae TaxID=1193713 RepID=UPI00203CE05A|nr:YitT family protein [Neobacillus mesonae]MCM3570439.1 YitT family protein [Neobacillus mesonae]
MFVRGAALVIGSILLAIGINGFLVPHHLIDGGIIGIALILHYYFDYQTGLCSVLLSAPLILYAFVKDRSQFHGSIYGMIVTAIFLDLLAPYHFYLPIGVSAVLGGAICGIGVGLMLRYKTSTGGTDLIAYFISKAAPLNIGLIIAFMDCFVVLLGFQTLGIRSVFFSALTILIAGALANICYERI